VAEVHLSEVNAASKHEPISYGATLAYHKCLHDSSDDPVILESIVSAEFIDDESKPRTSPGDRRSRPRVRKRRSSARRSRFACRQSCSHAGHLISHVYLADHCKREVTEVLSGNAPLVSGNSSRKLWPKFAGIRSWS